MSEQHEVTLIDRLSQTYGNSLEMTDESGQSRVFDLLAEFEISGKAYAVVQAVDSDEDADVLRITEDAAGGWQLETIESDEEWEDAMEQFDELAYSEELDG
ncbi:DUF1292 domain-containing protein [Paenibacillus taiwanensis]|uniref:DUF1292 domain-containing protein n=1 Tax=Paenibacillus taiwanensis TaxID=401638 RepID=UPI000415EA39|nr:DUF1292 domain-containing protein [Paenibacillus taiwanensis]